MSSNLLSVSDRASNQIYWSMARLQRRPWRRIVRRTLFLAAVAPAVAVWGMLLVAALFIRP